MSKVDLRIDWATYAAAKYACENWHYSKSIPKSKLVKIGAWENKNFVGVIIFSYGANANIGSPYGCQMNECVELTRIAMNEHKTPISRMLTIAVKFLKSQSPKLKLIVSYADQDENHHGGIYQACNWFYIGLKNSGTVGGYLVNNKKIHPKTMFDRHGTCSRIAIKKIYPNMSLFITKGKHKYLLPLDSEMKKKVETLAKPYPKRAKLGDDCDQQHSDGATPIRTLQSNSNLNQ